MTKRRAERSATAAQLTSNEDVDAFVFDFIVQWGSAGAGWIAEQLVDTGRAKQHGHGGRRCVDRSLQRLKKAGKIRLGPTREWERSRG